MKASRKIAVAAVGIAAAVVPLTLAAGSASAGDGWQRWTHRDAPGGHKYYCANYNGDKACFQPYDEKFYLGDGQKDGHYVILSWWSSSGRLGYVSGEGLGFGRWGSINKSFGESTKVTFRACTSNGTSDFTCGPQRTVSAGAE